MGNVIAPPASYPQRPPTHTYTLENVPHVQIVSEVGGDLESKPSPEEFEAIVQKCTEKYVRQYCTKGNYAQVVFWGGAVHTPRPHIELIVEQPAVAQVRQSIASQIVHAPIKGATAVAGGVKAVGTGIGKAGGAVIGGIGAGIGAIGRAFKKEGSSSAGDDAPKSGDEEPGKDETAGGAKRKSKDPERSDDGDDKPEPEQPAGEEHEDADAPAKSGEQRRSIVGSIGHGVGAVAGGIGGGMRKVSGGMRKVGGGIAHGVGAIGGHLGLKRSSHSEESAVAESGSKEAAEGEQQQQPQPQPQPVQKRSSLISFNRKKAHSEPPKSAVPPESPQADVAAKGSQADAAATPAPKQEEAPEDAQADEGGAAHESTAEPAEHAEADGDAAPTDEIPLEAAEGTQPAPSELEASAEDGAVPDEAAAAPEQLSSQDDVAATAATAATAAAAAEAPSATRAGEECKEGAFVVWRYADDRKNDPSLDIESHVKAYLQTHQDVVLERAVTNAMCLVMRPLPENAPPPLYGFARVPLTSRAEVKKDEQPQSGDGAEAKEEGANINEYKYTDATKMVPDYPRIISLIREWAKDGWSFKGVLASDHIDDESFPTWHELVFAQDDKAADIVYEYVRPADHTSVLQEGTADKLVNATIFKTVEAWAAQGWRCAALMWAKAVSKKANQEGKGKFLYDTAVIFKR